MSTHPPPATIPAPDIARSLAAAMEEAGLLIALQAPGLYARTAAFEAVVDAVDRMITGLGRADGPECLRFPPVIDQGVLERNGYFVGFPHLAGCIHGFDGDDADHRRLLGKLLACDPIADELTATGCALTPAACYPVYPLAAARGLVPAQGLLFDVGSYCFRNEPGDDPARMTCFRQREYVRIGTPDQVCAFRDGWLARSDGFMAALGLAGQVASAQDPFFGAGGAALAAGQAATSAKIEVLATLFSAERLTACLSLNSHGRHFAAAWGLRAADGTLSHSACIGFGLERLTLALFAAHGFDASRWPEPVRASLWPGQ